MLPPVERALDQIFEMHGRSACWEPIKPILKEQGFSIVPTSILYRLWDFINRGLPPGPAMSMVEVWKMARDRVRTILSEPLSTPAASPLNFHADLLQIIQKHKIGHDLGVPAHNMTSYFIDCLHQLRAHTDRQAVWTSSICKEAKAPLSRDMHDEEPGHGAACQHHRPDNEMGR